MPKFLQSRNLGLLISIGVFALVVWAVSRNLDTQAIVNTWKSSNPAWLAVALAAMVLFVISGIVRTHHIAEAVSAHPVSLWSATRVNWITMFLGLGAPVAAMADVARIGLAKVIMNVRVGEAIQIALYDRILGLFGMIVVGAILTPPQIWTGVDMRLVATQSVLWLGGLTGVAVFALAGRIPLKEHWVRIQKLADIVRKFLPLLLRPGFALRQFGFAWFYMISAAACLWALSKAIGLPLAPTQVLLFTPVILFVSSLPVFYAGWGGREAVVLATIGNLPGVGASHAVALSIAYGIVFMIVSLAGGLIWLAQPLPSLGELNTQAMIGVEAEQPGN